MSSYFILSQHTFDSNQLIVLNQPYTFLLPKTNLLYYSTSGLFEKYIIEWCQQFQHKDKIMLDIGAHTGTYSVCLAEHFKYVYSFEPQKSTYYALCGSIALSNKENVTCYQVGLGSCDQIGIQTLHIISEDGGGSTLLSHDKTLCKEEVEIRTLDSYQFDDVHFIKIDVEGNELNVLKGGIQTIQKNHPIILFECNCKNDELIDFLTNFGYCIAQLSNYSNMFIASYTSSPL
jgi:FkbM family methyltransferase